MIKFIIFKILIIIVIFQENLLARPISYSGGSTIMQKNSSRHNSIHIHYSPSYKYSVGYKGRYFRDEKMWLNGLQLNNLVKRWNEPDSQSNIYLKSSIGNVRSGSHDDIYAFIGSAFDYETRRYYVSYENIYYKSHNNLIDNFEQDLNIGIAPYIANYGNLHSWIILQINHIPTNNNQELTYTPYLRFFKSSFLTELGYSSNNRVIFNFIKRF
tara:strand:+ start:4622 stop:5260 length:639 start_codon:yes stop_codon:yes gene_type:complete